jgi:predicted ATPase/DNA-binding CsgD family transcriptional regulator
VAVTVGVVRAMFGASFVGRSADLDAVGALLAERRLVSVVGEGGVGKTRLAIEAAAAQREQGQQVAWADLAAARTPAGVRDAVVDALPAGAEAPSLEGLLQARLPRGVLVLDNCEHVADAAVTVVEAVDRACPDVAVLATTRERLGVPGEVVHRLQPLGLPVPGSTPQEATRAPAVALLIDRIRDVLGDFRVEDTNVDSVVALARVVEGSPLGLELAAARAGSLPLNELAVLLPAPLRQAAGSYRGGVARHHSLDASVRWSVDLLSPSGRVMLERLSVFADSFTLATARAVGDSVLEPASPSVEQVVSELVEASVVRALPNGRYRLPAAVRFLARDLLADAGLEAEARDRHADAVSALVVDRGPALKHDDQAAWLAMLDAELPEVRAAMDWHVQRDRPDPAAEMLLTTIDHWHIRGRYAEFTRRSEGLLGLRGLSRALRGPVLAITSHEELMAGRLAEAYRLADEALAAPGMDKYWRARALMNRAWCGFFSGHGSDEQIWADLDEADRVVRRSGDGGFHLDFLDTRRAALMSHIRSIPAGTELEAAVVARSVPLTRMALTGLVFQAYGPVLMDLRLDHRLAIAREALSQSRVVGYPVYEVMALAAVGTVAALRGEEERAERHLAHAAAIAADHDLPLFASIAQRWRAFAHYRFDRDDTAAQAERAVEFARVTSTQADAAAGLWLLGLTHLRSGDTDVAHQILTESSEASRDPSYPFSRLRAELGLAIIDLRHDRFQQALDRVHDAIGIASGLGDRLGLAAALDHLALLESLRGADDRAGRLIGAVDTLHAASSVARLPFEAELRAQAVAGLENAIGLQAATEAIAAGTSLTIEDAVRLARRARGARKRPPTGWDSLTPAEHDVVDLAVSGLTTPQIAARLFVSPNTVKTHLSQVYAKLDISSRAQLAALHTAHSQRS